MQYMIIRKLNAAFDVDYLSAWDAKWTASFCLTPHMAMRFADPAKLLAAVDRLQKGIPTFMDGRPCEYSAIECQPSTELTAQGEQFVMPGCEANKSPMAKQLSLWG